MCAPRAECAILRTATAVIAEGKHPVTFRTRKLSLPAPMVLHPGGCGRVGRRRNTDLGEPPLSGGSLISRRFAQSATREPAQRSARRARPRLSEGEATAARSSKPAPAPPSACVIVRHAHSAGDSRTGAAMRAPVPKRRGFANGGQPTDVVTHLNPESRVGAVITMP